MATLNTKQAVLWMLENQLNKRLSCHSYAAGVQIGTQGVVSPEMYIILHYPKRKIANCSGCSRVSCMAFLDWGHAIFVYTSVSSTHLIS